MITPQELSWLLPYNNLLEYKTKVICKFISHCWRCTESMLSQVCSSENSSQLTDLTPLHLILLLCINLHTLSPLEKPNVNISSVPKSIFLVSATSFFFSILYFTSNIPLIAIGIPWLSSESLVTSISLFEIPTSPPWFEILDLHPRFFYPIPFTSPFFPFWFYLALFITTIITFNEIPVQSLNPRSNFPGEWLGSYSRLKTQLPTGIPAIWYICFGRWVSLCRILSVATLDSLRWLLKAAESNKRILFTSLLTRWNSSNLNLILKMTFVSLEGSLTVQDASSFFCK